MIKLTRKDYWTLGSFVLMSLFLLVSFVTSDFFPINSGITGMTVVQSLSMGHDIGHISSIPEQNYIDIPIVFYIRIYNISSGDSLPNANCKINVAESGIVDMNYMSASKRYQYSYIFNSVGTYTYSINCDVSKYGSGNIVDSGTITVTNPLPDFVLNITAPGTSAAGNEIPIGLNIINIGYGSYEGPIMVDINFDTGNIISKQANMSGNTAILNLNHVYNNVADYTLDIEVNPERLIDEKNFSNNFIQHTIKIFNASLSPISCGNIDSSVLMENDFYCSGDISFTENFLELDCNGFKIYGDGKNLGKTAILVNKPLTIKNCVIENYGAGIISNSELILYNSTISDSGTALSLNSTGNNISYNIFKDNTLAIKNYHESKIINNDFLRNDINLNTNVIINFSMNYFGFGIYPNIISKLINESSEVIVIPYREDSIKSTNSNLVYPDIKGPEITATITPVEKDYSTYLTIKAVTDKPSNCRYSEFETDYRNMFSLSSVDMITHLKTLVYHDQKDLRIYIYCRDTNANPSSLYKSNSIFIRSSSAVALSEINDEIDFNKEMLHRVKNELEVLEEQLESEQNSLRIENIELDIKKKIIDINYFERLIDNAKILQSELWLIGNNTKDIQKDYINKYNNEFKDLLKNISSLDNEIDVALSVESDSIDLLFIRQLNNYELFYHLHSQNDSKTKELRDLRNDPILFVLDKQKRDLEIIKSKYIALDKIGELLSSDYLNDIDKQIIDIGERIIDARYDEAIDNFKLDIEYLERNIIFLRNYKTNLTDIVNKIIEAIEYSEKNSRSATAQKLVSLRLDIESLIRDIDNEINLIRSDIELVRDEMNSYNRLTKKIESNILDTIRINVDPIILDNKIERIISHPKMSLDKIIVHFNADNNSLYNLDLTAYSSSLYPDVQGSTTFEWYNISSSQGLNITLSEIYFKVEESLIIEKNISPRNMAVMEYDILENKWVINQVRAILEGDYYFFNYTLINNTIFALGYVNDNSREIIFGPCIPNWICDEYTECNESDERLRICRDVNECDEDNIEKEEISKCVDGQPVVDEEEEEYELTPEQPIMIEEPRSRLASIVRFILILIMVIGMISLVITRAILLQEKAKKESSEDEFVKEDYFNYDLIDNIIDRLFNYEPLEKIKENCITKDIDKNHLDYMVTLTDFVFGKLDETIPVKDITNELVKKGWKEEDAQHIVTYISSYYLMNQIKEYYAASSKNEGDDIIIKEIFKSDGFNDKLIKFAFKMYEMKKK
jgi:hypothetical protein